MDSKQREGENLADVDNSAKKRFKFKSFKNLFVKKKRKEPLPSLVSSGLKQSQSAGDVTAPDSMNADYDSEDDMEAAASVLGSRAVSHDSIFIPEMQQEPVRPIRVFSQESVSDRIKALQLRIHSNIRIGPPPFGLLSKRTEDPGTSSEDDGLPRSPPEMSLLHESIKTRISESHRHASSLSLGGTGSEEEEQYASETTSRLLSSEDNKLRDEQIPPETCDLVSPSADFSTPPQFSTFLDNSAARHRLSVKPKNQRSSKMRRPSEALLEESLICTNYMEVEDVAAPIQKQKDTSNAEVPTSNKDGSVPRKTDHFTRVKPVVQSSKKQKQFSSEFTLGNKSKSLPEELQSISSEDSTTSPQSQNIRHTVELAEKRNVSEKFVDRLHSKTSETTSSNLSITGKDGGPIIPVSGIEKHLVEDLKNPEQERISPMLRSIPTARSQESLQSRRGHFHHSPSQSTSQQPDKENSIQLGSMDINAERSPTDTGILRKFSVSSAWERPRTNSFTLKTNADNEAQKSTTLTLLKPDVSRTENLQDEYKSENKHIGIKKESLANVEVVSADKAVSSTSITNQSAGLAFSESSVATDPKMAPEGQSPVRLRMPSLSIRYRDGNPMSLKRHSAEIKLEKTNKDDIFEGGNADPKTAYEGQSPFKNRLPSLHLRYRDEKNPVSMKRHSAEIKLEKTGCLPFSKDIRCEGGNAEPETASEAQSPIRLRFPSLSLKYRDEINPVSIKRHSAEIKLEKPASEDEKCEGANTDLAVNRKHETKHKVDTDEVPQTKPPLARKPVPQNITLADSNLNKDVPESGSSQEKTSKSTETRNEDILSGRRMSLRKNIEKPPTSAVPAEPGKGGESKDHQPSWMSIARQKQLSFNKEHVYKQKTVNQESEKQNERTETPLKQQVDQFQSRKTNIVAVIVPETYGQEPSTEIREPRQRANTFPHPVHGTTLSLLNEKEEKPLSKRPTLSASEEPSWMELAKKKSQAWSDMPQIIK